MEKRLKSTKRLTYNRVHKHSPRIANFRNSENPGMQIKLLVGDILAIPADVLVSPANPWLNMSGGVNGEILSRCGMSIQNELIAHLEECGLKSVPATTAVATTAGGLPFKHIVHAVAIDPFYDSSEHIVARTIIASLELVDAFAARTVSFPALATGYGPLSHAQFSQAFSRALAEKIYLVEQVNIVVESDSQKAEIHETLQELVREKGLSEISISAL